MLKAEQARKIASENDPSKALETILKRVEVAAQAGKYSIKVRDYGFGGGEYYAPAQQWPDFGKKLIGELRNLGYSADIGSECRQFVDVWLEVSWEK